MNPRLVIHTKKPYIHNKTSNKASQTFICKYLKFQEYGVDDGTRTHDGWNHNPGLYQLSYAHHYTIVPFFEYCHLNMARLAGFEPATLGLEGRCSIQLSYRRKYYPSVYRLTDEYTMRNKHTYNLKLVGVERFELPTSCSQSRRATRLRYTPISSPRIIRMRRSKVNPINTDIIKPHIACNE